MGKSSGSVNVLIGATRTRGEEVGLGEESSRVVRFTQDKLVANSPKDSAEYAFVARGRCVGGGVGGERRRRLRVRDKVWWERMWADRTLFVVFAQTPLYHLPFHRVISLANALPDGLWRRPRRPYN